MSVAGSGPVTATRGDRAAGLLRRWGFLIAPMMILIVLFFLLPLVFMFRVSFVDTHTPSLVDALSGGWDTANYHEILADSFFYEMAFNSLALGFLTVIATLLIGYPVAWYLTRCSGWERTVISVACLLPLFVNIIVSVFGWYILMLPFGFFQKLLSAIGLIEGPFQILRSFWALVAVLTYEHLPFAVLILVAALQNVQRDKIDAARILGASPWRILRTILLPLSAPGIIATTVLVFSLAVSSYLVPILITGQRIMVVPIAIFSYTAELLDWSKASAMALLLLVVVAGLTYGMTVLSDRLTHRGRWEMV